MKRIKRKIKKCKKKYDKRLSHFWDFNLNPISGWRKPKKLGDTVLEEPELQKGDTHNVFSPKGFR